VLATSELWLIILVFRKTNHINVLGTSAEAFYKIQFN